jgi:hypothetical protein
MPGWRQTESLVRNASCARQRVRAAIDDDALIHAAAGTSGHGIA